MLEIPPEQDGDVFLSQTGPEREGRGQDFVGSFQNGRHDVQKDGSKKVMFWRML
jgi:hypothetical protein